MTHSETTEGTPVIEMTADEHREFVDQIARRRLDMSADEFQRCYRAAKLDDSDPDVGLLAALTANGEYGDRAAA